MGMASSSSYEPGIGKPPVAKRPRGGRAGELRGDEGARNATGRNVSGKGVVSFMFRSRSLHTAADRGSFIGSRPRSSSQERTFAGESTAHKVSGRRDANLYSSGATFTDIKMYRLRSNRFKHAQTIAHESRLWNSTSRSIQTPSVSLQCHPLLRPADRPHRHRNPDLVERKRLRRRNDLDQMFLPSSNRPPTRGSCASSVDVLQPISSFRGIPAKRPWT